MTTPVYYSTFLVGEMLSGAGYGAAYGAGNHGLGQGVHFRYAPEWRATRGAFPISTAMPLTGDLFGPEIVEPWFANLLPEEANLRAVAQALGAAEGDVETILAAIGGDTAGALSFGVPNNPEQHEYLPLVEYYRRRKGKTFAGPQDAFAYHISELGARPFMVDDDGVRTSLAGGQEKSVLAVLENGLPDLNVGEDCIPHLAVPLSGAPSTVIVKPDNPRLPGIVENEAYCLELARRIGLPVVDWAIIAGSDGRPCLAVNRYDRRHGAKGLIRVHQEDFAQALGFPPRQKYERSTGGGPSLTDILSVGRRLTHPKDRLRLLDYTIYNILVANTDAHAKNYSLILERGGDVVLAPLYDVTCVIPWADVPVNQYHAQNLGRRKRSPQDMQKRYWHQLAVASGYNPRETLRRVREMIDAMVAEKEASIVAVSASDHANDDTVRVVADAVEEVALRIGGRL